MSESLPFTQSPAEPSLKDVLDQLRKSILLELCAHHVGTVQSFDAAKQTARVTINYKKTYFRLDQSTGLYSPQLVDYPVLVDSPVIFLGGGPSGLTFPVVQGDECVVLFNDRDLDNWFAGGSGKGTATTRLHSFADGLILVGVRSLGNVLTNFDTARAVLRGSKDGTTMVGVGPTLIKIANSSYTLNGLLQDLITQVKALVDATANITVTPGSFVAPPGAGGGPVTGTSGTPVNASTITSVKTNLSTTASHIAGLLE